MDKQTAGYITTLLADEFGHGFSDQQLCVICGGENGTNGHHYAVFSVDIAFAHHPPPSTPIGVLAIQLVIHSTFGA